MITYRGMNIIICEYLFFYIEFVAFLCSGNFEMSKKMGTFKMSKKIIMLEFNILRAECALCVFLN